jgi:putative NADH-flavin reductase
MNLVIFGATGGTGQQVVKAALDQGHTVTTFVRDPDRLSIQDQRIKVIIGDVFDPESVLKGIQNQEAVICVLGGGRELKKTTVRATGTEHIIQAMQAHQVNRLIVVTAMGIGESWNTLSPINKIFFATVLSSARSDHENQEAAVKESELDWTIIRPSGLTDGPRTGEYQYGENLQTKSSTITRSDVADLIMKALEDDQLISKALTITN